MLLVEAERDLRALDQDRPPDQVRVLHHQIDRFLLRLRQSPLLEHRASRAHEIEEAARVDVLLEEFARRRILVDVDLLNVDTCLVQKTSGVLAGGSGRLRVESRLGHRRRIIEVAEISC